MRGPSEHKFHLAKLQTFYFRVLNENRGRGGPLPRALSAHSLDFSLEGGLDGPSLRVTFPYSHPLARRDLPVALRGVSATVRCMSTGDHLVYAQVLLPYPRANRVSSQIEGNT
jgi:hypothetical protein